MKVLNLQSQLHPLKKSTIKYVRSKLLVVAFAMFIAFQSLPAVASATTRSNCSNGQFVQDTATFGTGCFWCTEAIFQQVKGVLKVESGYSGGHLANPTYEEVSSGTTGHAECLQVIYDPAVISYAALLEMFWEIHDPTSVNRQGNDIGSQYRSVIFYKDSSQHLLAEEYKKGLDKSGAYTKPIATSIEPLTQFYKAEDYHQNYYNQNPMQPYCEYFIGPKIDKFRNVFKSKVKEN